MNGVEIWEKVYKILLFGKISRTKVNCAYKFELILKPEQRAKCAQFVGNCRYVYNKAVEIQIRQLENKRPFVSYKELASQLVGWKKDDSSLWLSEFPAQTLQQALKDLDRGLTRFKQHKGGMVRFKARGDGALICMTSQQRFLSDDLVTHSLWQI